MRDPGSLTRSMCTEYQTRSYAKTLVTEQRMRQTCSCSSKSQKTLGRNDRTLMCGRISKEGVFVVRILFCFFGFFLRQGPTT